MKRYVVGVCLILVGLLLMSVAAIGAAAQTPDTCFISASDIGCNPGDQDAYIAVTTSCADCFAAQAPLGWHKAWYGEVGGVTDCYTGADQCAPPTAVTFLGFGASNMGCSSGWGVAGVGVVGLVAAAAGLVTLGRERRRA